MRVGVKICGIRDAATLDAAVRSGADWVGFVLVTGSPRVIDPVTAATLARLLPSDVRPVLLLVDPDDAAVDAVRRAIPGATLQIYAGADRIAGLKGRGAGELWHAVPLADGMAPPTSTAADRLVIERAPARAGLPGGHGGRLDWGLLAVWQAPCPWLLAGGLDPDNVGEAIRASGAAAVDVSSGVERARGVKDAELIGRFVAAARSGGALPRPPPDAGHPDPRH